jgi:hypothetical protein
VALLDTDEFVCRTVGDAMADCTITITSIVGEPVPNPPIQCETYVRISGTISSSGSECQSITVTANCDNSTTPFSGTIDTTGAVTGDIIAGYLAGDTWQVTLFTSCCCDSQFSVSASCSNINCSVNETVTLQCQPPCCPTIAVTDISYGACELSGSAVVTFKVAGEVPPGCPDPQLQIDFGDNSPPETISTYTFTHTYGSGSYVATINVISPPGCPPVQIPINVQCPNCCPIVSVTPCIPDCDGNADRTVTFTITVTPPPLPCPQYAISAQMDFGDGTYGQTISLGPGQSYSGTEPYTYTGSSALVANTASLQITSPAQCAGLYSPHVIPACCTKARAAWCTLLFWIMSVAFVFALVFLLFAVLPGPTCPTCVFFTAVPGYYTPLYCFYLFAIIGVAALILYLLFCTKCRCDWVYLLLARILFGAGLFYFIFAACSLGIWSVVIGLLLMLLGYLLLKKWQSDCCVTLCAFLRQLLWFVVWLMPIAVFLAGSLSGGCVYDLFFIPTLAGSPPHIVNIPITTLEVASFAAAALTGYYASQC